MSKNKHASPPKKRRKAHCPRPVVADPIALVRFAVAKPQKSSVEQICGVLKTAFKALREGVATIGHWSVLAGAVDVSLAVEKLGKVRGVKGHLINAEGALASVYNRSNLPGGWKQSLLYFFELDVIKLFLELHELQINSLSNAEYLQACQVAANKIGGSGGGYKPLIIEQLDHFSMESAKRV